MLTSPFDMIPCAPTPLPYPPHRPTTNPAPLPQGPERAAELGSWAGRSVTVEGTSWTASTVDLAVAGLGWVGVGLDGAANLRVWTYEGVGVTVRDALIPDYAKELETPGFDFEKAGKTKGGRTTVRAPRKR